MTPGNMTPQYELVQPISIESTYQGITSISVGTISVLNMPMKITFRSGKLNLASVYPASESKKTTLAVVIRAITRLLKNQRKYEVSRNTSR